MISMMIFLLVLGLIVFGPKKTIEMAQSVWRSVAQLKKSVAESELGSIMNPNDDVSRRIDAILTQQQAPLAQPPAAAVNPDHSHSTGLA
jgi:Sec-independent protein translocase protein TatA